MKKKKMGNFNFLRKRPNRNIWFSVLFMIGLVAFLSWAFWSARIRALADLCNDKQLIIAKSAAQGIEEFMIPLMQELDRLSRLPSVRYMKDFELLDKSLTLSLQRFKYQFLSFARINENGIVTYTYPYNEHLQGQNLGEMEYIQQVNTTLKRAISHPFITPDGNRVIALADPIRPKGEKYMGIIQAWVSLESLRQLFISPILSEANTLVFIYDNDGNLIEGPNEDFVGKHYTQLIDSQSQSSMLDLITKMINGEQGTSFNYAFYPHTQRQDTRQEKMLTAFAPIRFLLKDHWWSIGVSTSYSSIVVLSKKILHDEIVLVVLTAVLLFIFGTFLFFKEKKEQMVIIESEEKFRSLAEQSPNMIFINKNGRLMYANKKFEELTGYTREEVFSPDFNFLTLIAPEFRKNVKTNFSRHMKGEDIISYEYVFISKGGKRIESIMTTKLISYGRDNAILGVVTEITERKKVKDALRKSEERFRSIVENSHEGIVILDDTFRIIYCNDELVRILGYSYEEIINKDFREFLDEENKALAVDYYTRRQRGENVPSRYELKIVRKDGEKRFVEISSAVIKDSEGKVESVVQILDIAESKQAEEALRKSESRYRTLFEGVPVGLYRTAPDGRILDVNPELVQMLGYPDHKSMLAINAKDVYVDPEDHKQWQTIIDSDGFVRSIEYRMKRFDGEVIWVQDTVRVVIDGKGQVLFYEGSLQDITERKRTEKTLHKSEEKFRNFVETSADMVFQLTKTGHMDYVSSRVKSLYGYQPDELIGKHLRATTPAEDVPKAIKALNMILAGKPLKNFEINQKDKAGRIIPMEINAVPVYKGKKIVGAQGIMRDITERKKTADKLSNAYEELKKTQQELVQSEKMAALGRFSSGVAHEIRNPLGIILIGMEFLERKFSKTDVDIKKPIEKIKDATLRADTIVKSLLQFARPSELKTEKIKPEDLIDEALSLIKYKSSLHNIKIETHFAKEKLFIEVDKNQIQQVLINMLINAIEAMPKGGVIKIKTYETTQSKYSRVKPECVIEITDMGEGISEDNLTMIFEPFFTTKRDKKGIGLGMFMSKMIVINHNGDITVDSKVGKGTEVTIFLPIASEGVKDNEKKQKYPHH